MHAVDLNAVLHGVEPVLRHLAEGAHAVAPEPAGLRQFQHPRQSAVIGQQQQALGVDVEPADREHARQVLRQRLENGGAAFGVEIGRHQAARLVVEPEPRALARRQRLAIDQHDIGRLDVEGRAFEHRAIHADAAFRDHRLAVAA